MSDVGSAYPVPKPFLTSRELLSVQLPLRRRGVDPKVVEEIRQRAVATINTLYATIDELQSERDAMLAGDGAEVPDARSATKLLEAATRTADSIVADAQARADEIDAEIAERRAGLEDELGLEDERLERYRASIDAEMAEMEQVALARRAELDAEMDRWERELLARRAEIEALLHDLMGRLPQIPGARAESSEPAHFAPAPATEDDGESDLDLRAAPATIQEGVDAATGRVQPPTFDVRALRR